MGEKKNFIGWFERKVSKNTGKEYGSGSFSPQNIQDLVELSKKNSKGYVNFFWNIYQDKPSITLCEPREWVTVEQVRQVFPDSKVDISDVPW